MTAPGASNISPADLLRKLGSGVVPDGSRARAHGAPLESASFQDLLRKVRGGELGESAPVGVRSGVEADLSPESRQTLEQAVDAAEAAGARTLLALHEGRVMTVDVARREIVEVREVAPGEILTGADAIVRLDQSADSDGAPVANVRLSLGPGENASLARLLAERDDKGDGDARRAG